MPPASCVSDSAKIDFQEKLIPERGLREVVEIRKSFNLEMGHLPGTL
jgi:hypothetical protein